MKYLPLLLALALAGTACQQQAPATRVVVPVKAPATSAPMVKAIAAPPAQVLPADSLTPAMRVTLRQVDIGALFLAPEPQKVGDYQSVLDGFFGSNPQRLSMAILRATRDSLQPNIYHVVGKTRYKQRITSFAGTIQVTKLADYYDQRLLLSQGDDDLHFEQDSTSEAGGAVTNARAYSAAATFRFNSEAGAPSSCTLTGQVLLDFWLNDAGKMDLMYTMLEGVALSKAPTKGSGLLLKGTWQDVATNSQKPFLVSRDIFLLSPDIIPNFGVGDRSSQVNPKYAKQGWNTYWENDEWWADTPKIALNL